jgi:uncharacterized protein (DUF1697 family)
MITFIALLRGINVGGKHPVRMEALRQAFESLGLRGVQTYIQSGNVVFQAVECQSLPSEIERRLTTQFGFAIPVVVRTATQWSTVLADNPFVSQRNVDQARLHVVFLTAAPRKNHVATIPQNQGADAVRFARDVVYLYAPGGYAKTPYSNDYLERHLGVRATTRNWSTVKKLGEMAGAVPPARR